MNLNYHIHESSTRCPYCNKECQDYDYEVVHAFDTRIELECKYCGKKFFAEPCIVFNTYADCDLNGETHDWYETHIKGFYLCNKCEQCKDEKREK